jgi:hypothetical protein
MNKEFGKIMDSKIITSVMYESGFKLFLQFEDGAWRIADLKKHLDGEMFEPLKNPKIFASAQLNPDIDTVVWDNGADMSPDFLYEISVPVERVPQMKAAETGVPYKTKTGL